MIVLLLLTAPATATASGASIGQTETTDLDPDGVVLSIELHQDGAASWSIEHRYRLGDSETEEAFDSLAADIENNRSAFVDRFAERMELTVRSAEDSTGREMAIQEITITAEKRNLPQQYGVIRYQFEWSGFALTDEQSITAGDALSGLFLDDETRLLISWPNGYTIESVSPEPSDRRDQTVIWLGPTDFGPNEPTLVVSTDDPAPPAQSTETSIWSVVPLPVAAGLVAIGLVVSVAFWRWRSKFSLVSPLASRSASETGDEEGDDPTGEAETQNGAGDEPRWELMSNEEKVLRLLEAHDGRVKQQVVVQTFGWSDANASQVIRELREAGTIETFRIGRENVIVLADEDGNATL